MSAIYAIPVTLVMIDADANPPRCEATFVDAAGNTVRVIDKEPIFRAGDEPPGCGEIQPVS